MATLQTYRVPREDHVLFAKLAKAIVEALPHPKRDQLIVELLIEFVSKAKKPETLKLMLESTARVVLATMLEYLDPKLARQINDVLTQNKPLREQAEIMFDFCQRKMREGIQRGAAGNGAVQQACLTYLKGGMAA